MNSRRQFLLSAAIAPALVTPSLGSLSSLSQSFFGMTVPPAPLSDFPRITFYGATRQVSGSCHLLETSYGLYVVDCGSFISDVEDPEAENQEFPFEPSEVKALLLTHAHADHIGRLPLLYRRGFRGNIYCTDATRDITTLAFSSGPSLEDDENRLFDPADVEGTLKLFKTVPYNKKVDAEKLTVRYTEAGHMLGSAMIEVWADNRKILFGGDMGPDNAPILISPAQHYGADAVLVESTYGPTPRTEISYEAFGKQIQQVLDRGGDVLIPTFAIHKSQLLIFTIQRLKDEGVIAKEVPIYCDSSTVHRGNLIYDAYSEYHDEQAKAFAQKHGTLFYFGKYREGKVRDYINAHSKTPSIYVSTSGMMAFAASPRHLHKMASDSRNAVFIPGYQAPDTVGRQLLDGKKNVRLVIEDGNSREVNTQIDLQVERVSGFSSHATGQQILEWVSRFEQVGPIYVVHGDEQSSTGIAEKLVKMGLAGQAPKRNETFTVKGERTKPGAVPELTKKAPPAPAAVDQ